MQMGSLSGSRARDIRERGGAYVPRLKRRTGLNCIHTYWRIGGSRKELYFQCIWCRGMRVKRRGTDIRFCKEQEQHA